MKTLKQKVDEFVATYDENEPIKRDKNAEKEKKKLIEKTLKEGSWEALSGLYGYDMKPMRLRVEETHARGEI